MKQVLIFIMLTFITANLVAQEDPERTIGIACGGAGSAMPPVRTIESLLTTKQYDKIRSQLYARNPAVHVLAVIVLEELSKRNLVRLSNKDKQRMSTLYQSDKQVWACKGCTFWEERKIGDILNNRDNESMRQYAELWVKEIINPTAFAN